ncbi:MAG: ABC transporter ATP-binding protein [bacterium]
MYIVEAEDLRKIFGDFAAVDGISFQLHPGECLGILGPNGAGKTTTIRMVYGFSPMTSGRLLVFGLDIVRQLRTIKSRIGVCQQENNLDPDLSVQDNLTTFAGYFDIPKAEAARRAGSLLEFIALDHRRQDTVMELSGGMMRRLVLARALINEPELLILDEPTTGLDPQSRHQVWDRLGELRSRGLSILLTTHYMDEAARLCDRLMIVDYGRILVQGRPIDLIREHIGYHVLEISSPSRELRSYVQSNHLIHEDLGHRLIIYEQENNNLFQKLSQEYCTEECILRMATLEDVFLKLTGRDLRE